MVSDVDDQLPSRFGRFTPCVLGLRYPLGNGIFLPRIVQNAGWSQGWPTVLLLSGPQITVDCAAVTLHVCRQ